MLVLLYGYESWKFRKGEEKRLDSSHNKCLRKILKVRWQQRMTNVALLRAAVMDKVSEELNRSCPEEGPET